MTSFEGLIERCSIKREAKTRIYGRDQGMKTIGRRKEIGFGKEIAGPPT